MEFTLRFYALGTPIKGNNYKIYLRYYTSGTSLNLPTKYTMTKEQVKMVNKGEYGGAVQDGLDMVRMDLRQAIINYQINTNALPSPIQLKEFYDIAENILPIEWYVSEYLKQLTTKKSSKDIYTSHLKQFKQYYNTNLFKLPLKSVIHKSTVENYGLWLQAKNQVQQKSISRLQVYNMKGTAQRLLNFIADKLNQPKIPFYLEQPDLNDHYTPSKEEFEAITTVVVHIKAHRRVQDMTALNGFWGLRINELLSIRKQNITFNGDHLSVRFRDSKNKKSRDVVLTDPKGIEIVKKYMNTQGDYLCRMDDSFYNKFLKEITRLALGEKATYIYNAKEEKELKHELADKITSHSIRRYAVIRNIELYGIDVARTFSGHKNYEIVVRHYAKDFLDKQVALKTLRRGY